MSAFIRVARQPRYAPKVAFQVFKTASSSSGPQMHRPSP